MTPLESTAQSRSYSPNGNIVVPILWACLYNRLQTIWQITSTQRSIYLQHPWWRDKQSRIGNKVTGKPPEVKTWSLPLCQGSKSSWDRNIMSETTGTKDKFAQLWQLKTQLTFSAIAQYSYKGCLLIVLEMKRNLLKHSSLLPYRFKLAILQL